MGNDNLKTALRRAALSPDDFADIIEVDPKTVQRWLAGRAPYPRHRGKIARALDTTEHKLWPELTPALRPPARGFSTDSTGDLVAGYPQADDPQAPTPETLIATASKRIDLLDLNIEQLINRPGVPELLIAKAAEGCRVRILCYEPFPYVDPLLDHPGIEIRRLDLTEQPTIHRYDQHILLILPLLTNEPTDPTPALIHLRRTASEGLFDRLAAHLDDAWEHNSEPLTPTEDPGAEYDADASDDEGENEGEPYPRNLDAESRNVQAPDWAASAPRRWPRRPA